MARSSIIRGTLVLSSANFFNRVLGLVNQGIALRIIGSEGYGLYQIAIPLYLLALVLTTSGIPVAISKLVAEARSRGDSQAAHQVLRWTALRMGIAGCILAGIVAGLLPLISKYILVDARAQWCLLVLLPTLPITAVSSALRGYYQGMQQMTLPAVAQTLEQIIRVGTGIYFTLLMNAQGITWAVSGYAAGIFFGELAGCLLLLFFYRRKFKVERQVKKPVERKNWGIRQKIWPVAGPVTLTRIISVLVLNIEAMLIPTSLQNMGYSTSEAIAIFGLFTGVMVTLISIPGILTSAISTNLLPAVSAAKARNDQRWLKSKVSQSCIYTVMASLPILVILWILPEEITKLVFNATGVLVPLRILVCGGIFLYLAQISNGILYGLGQAKRVLTNATVVALIRVAGIWSLARLSIREDSVLLFHLSGILEPGLLVIALAYVGAYVASAGLNLLPLGKYVFTKSTGQRISISYFAALCMGFIMLVCLKYSGLFPLNSGYLGYVLAILFGGAVYLLLLIWSGVLSQTFKNP